jgi:hypothetical protein
MLFVLLGTNIIYCVFFQIDDDLDAKLYHLDVWWERISAISFEWTNILHIFQQKQYYIYYFWKNIISSTVPLRNVIVKVVANISYHTLLITVDPLHKMIHTCKCSGLKLIWYWYHDYSIISVMHTLQKN